MKRACILTIGSELVEGIILDKNSQYLSRRLLELGYRVRRIASVDDVLDDIEREVRESLKLCDLVVTSGGLGPTEDDLTREAVAKALGRKLVFDEDLYERISKKVKVFAGKVVESIKREAMVIEGARVIWNDVGSAPGQLLKAGEKIVLVLPGPPAELENVFNKVADEIRVGEGYVVKTLKFFGVRESVLEDELRDIIYSKKGIKVATQASYTKGVWIRFTAPRSMEDELIEVVGKIKELRGRDIYAEDEETMEERVVKLLMEKNLTIGTAESCTGGMLSSTFVNVPGVSKVFKGGIIAYDNSVKIGVLKVSEETLKKHGAVSEECVREMADGVKKLLNVDVAVAISGIAGPTGGTPEKPVGLVYIDVLYDEHGVIRGNFRGDRNTIRTRSVMEALDNLRRRLGG